MGLLRCLGWPFLAVFGRFLACFRPFWPSFGRFRPFWPFVAWSVLAVSGRFGRFWPLLAGFGGPRPAARLPFPKRARACARRLLFRVVRAFRGCRSRSGRRFFLVVLRVGRASLPVAGVGRASLRVGLAVAFYLPIAHLHRGHCRARLLPFGTVGNGRLSPAEGVDFRAKRTEKLAIPKGERLRLSRHRRTRAGWQNVGYASA